MFQSSSGDSTRVCLLADAAWPEGNAISAAEDECIRQTTNNRLKYGRRNPPNTIYVRYPMLDACCRTYSLCCE